VLEAMSAAVEALCPGGYTGTQSAVKIAISPVTWAGFFRRPGLYKLKPLEPIGPVHRDERGCPGEICRLRPNVHLDPTSAHRGSATKPPHG
jgi:hypothetical protein